GGADRDAVRTDLAFRRAAADVVAVPRDDRPARSRGLHLPQVAGDVERAALVLLLREDRRVELGERVAGDDVDAAAGHRLDHHQPLTVVPVVGQLAADLPVVLAHAHHAVAVAEAVLLIGTRVAVHLRV